MKDHPDTLFELEKLDIVKTFLKKETINVDEDLIYYYEQSKR